MKALLLLLSILICIYSLPAQTVIDVDGNEYSAATIGNQVWFTSNLKTSKYNDGIPITLVAGNSQWTTINEGAYCWYNNDSSTYQNPYGKLYNWYAINTGKLCPTGWKVPSADDWRQLITFLGGDAVAGGKMKETGTVHWLSPNTAATNEYNFTALPGGYRSFETGEFNYSSYAGFWWARNSLDASSAFYYNLNYDHAGALEGVNNKRRGFSVTCLRNSGVGTEETHLAQTISVYPNPANNIIYFNLNVLKIEKIILFNMAGNILKEWESLEALNEIDVSSLTAGVYVIEFIGTDSVVQRKLVKR